MHFNFFKISLLILVLIASCQKKAKEQTDFKVIGHAVTGLYNPQRIYKDNTLEAINYAVSFEDLDGIEIDLQMSKDGTFWLYHDENLSSQTDESGEVGSLSNEELKKVQYKTLNKERLTALDVVTFPEFESKFELYLDLKDFNYRNVGEADVDEMIEEIDKFKSELPENVSVRVILPNLEFLNKFVSNGINQIYTDVDNYASAIQLKADFPDLEGIFIRNSAVSKEDVSKMLNQNLEVIIFDMRSLSSIRRALEKGTGKIMVEEFRTALPEKF